MGPGERKICCPLQQIQPQSSEGRQLTSSILKKPNGDIVGSPHHERKTSGGKMG